jgi:protein-S-isoprenylcysteine O-methyltransferase Ste14
MYTKKQLLGKALSRFILGLIFISAILFIPAGSIEYWNAWLFIGILFIPILFVGIYLIIRDPELLDKRLNSQEKENKQKKMVLFTTITFLAGFILSGLDYRFGWSSVPLFLVVLSAIMVLIGYIMFFMVIRQNRYASRVVEVQEKQKVIDTGFYGVVRHPMYSAAILMFLFTPLVLGSFIALIPFLIFPFQMNIRIKNEEQVLEEGLDGYVEYKKRVKYKVIPFIW